MWRSFKELKKEEGWPRKNFNKSFEVKFRKCLFKCAVPDNSCNFFSFTHFTLRECIFVCKARPLTIFNGESRLVRGAMLQIQKAVEKEKNIIVRIASGGE